MTVKSLLDGCDPMRIAPRLYQSILDHYPEERTFERCRFSQSLPRILAAIDAIMQCEPVYSPDDRLVIHDIGEELLDPVWRVDANGGPPYRECSVDRWEDILGLEIMPESLDRFDADHLRCIILDRMMMCGVTEKQRAYARCLIKDFTADADHRITVDSSVFCCGHEYILYVDRAWILHRSGRIVPVTMLPASPVNYGWGGQWEGIFVAPEEHAIYARFLQTRSIEDAIRLEEIYLGDWCRIREWSEGGDVTCHILGNGSDWMPLLRLFCKKFAIEEERLRIVEEGRL